MTRVAKVNVTVIAVREAWLDAERRRADRWSGGEGGVTARSVRQRWGAFLLQTGRASLTPAQRRSVRRRSTRVELLSLTSGERLLIGAQLR